MMDLPTVCPATIVYAFRQSDLFARVIVLLLFVLSIYAWTIMCEKGVFLRRANRRSRTFLATFDRVANPLIMLPEAERFRCPVAAVYEAGVEEVMTVLRVDRLRLDDLRQGRGELRGLTIHELDRVRNAMERTVDAQVALLEERLGWLGTIVTISPFLGLLGTVWGVMMAFCGLAQRGRPEISAIAPGVSGALLTTVVGLFVAIPSVVGYNAITNGVRRATADMDNFVEDFMTRLKLESAAD